MLLLQKFVAQDDFADQRLQLETFRFCASNDFIDDKSIGGCQFASQGEAEQVSGESLCKPLVFLHQCFLKFDNVCEVVLLQERATGIDVAFVFVLITPATGDVEVFKSEAKWVKPCVTPGTVRVFAVLRELFANGQTLR